MMASALADLRVLDISTDVAGPFCARLLGDFGADVIKVEAPSGDPARDLLPFKDALPGPEHSGFFAYLNTNKRGMTLDLTSVAGQALFRALVTRADIVVESMPPGRLDEMALGYERLEAAKPGLVLTSITPFGQTGPWRDRQGNDLTAYALSGWASINGMPDGPPLKGSGWQASFVGGLAGFFGTLSALVYRDRHGVGQQVDVSVVEALAELFGPRLLQVEHAGVESKREKPDFFRGPVACRDGYFSLTISRAHFWRDAMNELGLPELAENEQFWNRMQHRAELSAKVEPKIAERSKRELFDQLALLRVVCGMVLTTEELYSDPHVRDRAFFVEVDQPGIGRVEMPGAPFKMTATPWSLRRPAPGPGEHTDEVLRDLLALDDDDIAGLRREGVVA